MGTQSPQSPISPLSPQSAYEDLVFPVGPPSAFPRAARWPGLGRAVAGQCFVSERAGPGTWGKRSESKARVEIEEEASYNQEAKPAKPSQIGELSPGATLRTSRQLGTRPAHRHRAGGFGIAASRRSRAPFGFSWRFPTSGD